MELTREWIDELYRERTLRARRMSPEEKLLAGPRLFDLACRIAMDGIREQHPEADEAEVRRILSRQLAIHERLKQGR